MKILTTNQKRKKKSHCLYQRRLILHLNLNKDSPCFYHSQCLILCRDSPSLDKVPWKNYKGSQLCSKTFKEVASKRDLSYWSNWVLRGRNLSFMVLLNSQILLIWLRIREDKLYRMDLNWLIRYQKILEVLSSRRIQKEISNNSLTLKYLACFSKSCLKWKKKL